MATTGIFKLTDTYNQQQQAAWPTTARGTEPFCFTFAANAAYIGNTTVYYTTCNPNVTVNVSLILAGGFTNYNFNKPILYYITANNTTYGNTVIPSTNQQYSFNVGKGNSYIFSTIASYAGTNLTAFSNVTNTIAPVFTLPGTPVITLVTANVANAANALIYFCHSDRGTNITSNAVIYYAVSNPGNIQVTANTTIINVPGLTACQPYTFTVKASNFLGNSSVSAASSSVTPLGDATVGIFFIGQSTTYTGTTSAYDKYTFASDGNVNQGFYGYYASGFGASNKTNGLYHYGMNLSTLCTPFSRFKFIYAGCIASSGTAASFNSYGSGATGNGTVGIFQGNGNGYPSTVPGAALKRDRYTYAGDTQVAGTSVVPGRQMNAMTYGNDSVGIFKTVNIADRYTYSNDAVAASTAGATCNPGYHSGAALSTATFGIALSPPGFEKYTFSSDTKSISISTSSPNFYCSVAPLSHSQYASTGNSTRGIMTLGFFSAPRYTGGREKYTYSNDSLSSATSQSYQSTCLQGGGFSNGIQGVSR
jgi:hypothetical protein